MEQNPIGIRASAAGRICTEKPFSNEVFLLKVEKECCDKVSAKVGRQVVPWEIQEDFQYYKTEVKGVKGIVESYEKILQTKAKAELDPLPKGAKTYAQELWLQYNHDFYNFSLKDNNPKMKKGRLAEDEAIALIGEFREIPNLEKNEERLFGDFISGTPDMRYEIEEFGKTIKVVRDSKVQITCWTFRKKFSIESSIYWQLVAYAYLDGAERLWVDNVLMPTPEEMIEDELRNLSESEQINWWATQESITNLPLNMRIKSYEIPPNKIAEDIKFLVSRLEKFKRYYETLTYEICMNF